MYMLKNNALANDVSTDTFYVLGHHQIWCRDSLSCASHMNS